VNTTNKLLRLGVLVTSLQVAGDIVASLTYRGYSYLHQTISELNAFGAPTRPMTITFGVVVYVLIAAFGAGVWRAAAGDRRLRVAGALLIALALISLVAVPGASMQMRGVEQGQAGAAHLVEGALAMSLIVAAMGTAAAAVRGAFRAYSIATMVVFLGFAAWSGAEALRIEAGLATPWVGVKERVAFYSYYAWFAVLALTLLRRARSLAGPQSGNVTRPVERSW
jgi:hypothetical protein